MSEQQNSRELLDLQEVRKITGMGRTWLYTAPQEGRFPNPIRLGRRIRWVAADIDQWLLEQRRQAGNA